MKPNHRVKIPASFFRDFDENGPLFVILETIVGFCTAGEFSSSLFNDPMKRHESMQLFDRVKLALEKVRDESIFSSTYRTVSYLI